MEPKMLLEYTHNCIVTASQLAYMEKDMKTYSLLKNIDEVLQYFSKNVKEVPLYQEIQVLEKYVLTQKVKYGERFSLNVNNCESYRDIFISHMKLIGLFDRVLIQALDKYEENLEFRLKFYWSPDSCFRLQLVTAEGREEFDGSINP